MSKEDIASQFLSSDFFNSMNDSAVSVDPTTLMNSNGLGIKQEEQSQKFGPATMSPADMLSPSKLSQVGGNNEVETHRRTLTQEEFNSFAHGGDYVPDKPGQSTVHDSPAQGLHNGLVLENYFPEIGDLNFDTQLNDESMGSSEMQHAFSTDSYDTTASTFSEAATKSTVDSTAHAASRNPSTQSSVSDWSEHSTPSLSITPAFHHTDSGYGESDECDISPRAKVPARTIAQWQPGQSVPVDFAAIDREFREAAMRSATQAATHARRSPSIPFGDLPMQAFGGENQAALTQSIGNLGINNDIPPPLPTARAPINLSGGIAARRQRPRPQPLSSTSLRSASYCGSLPTASGIPSSHSNLTPAVPTLRRIKSSNVMNGIANGRIQKSIGAQRSPLNFSFAEAMNSPKFARSVSSHYSPAQAALLTSTSLAPPTPLSPSELPTRLDLQRQWAQLQGGQHMSRETSINETMNDNAHMLQAGTVPSNVFSSPPTTPMYATNFSRQLRGNGMMSETTPPQSAPANQQCFSNGMSLQQAQLQAYQNGMMQQAQQQSYMPVMAQEYPQMPNVVMPSMQLPNGQYIDMAAHYAAMGMVPPSQSVQYNNTGMPFAQGMSSQSLTPPHHQYPMVPSSPGILLSSQSQMQSKTMPQADFFVHEYNPPRNLKRECSPRRPVEAAPKNYTFANHGPEHFEKGSKGSKGDITSSPGSSTGSSATG